MPKQELDLLQIATAFPAKLRTCPPQVVGTEALYADLPRGRLDYTPDGAVAKLIPVELASFRHRPKQLGVFDRGGRHPCIDSMFDPHRNGNRADPTTFATHIDDDPSSLSELDLFDFEVRELVPPKCTAHEHCHNTVVSLALERGAVRDRKQILGLLASQPVPHPCSLLADIRDIRHLVGLIVVEKAIAPGLAHQLPHSREAAETSLAQEAPFMGRIVEFDIPWCFILLRGDGQEEFL